MERADLSRPAPRSRPGRHPCPGEEAGLSLRHACGQAMEAAQRRVFAMADHKVEHLKMVQGVVARMAGNSAQMKTWAVSLVTAVVVLSGLSDDPHWLIGVGGCVPVIAFWAMDARYLHLERCYVKLHDAIVAGVEVRPFDLDYRAYAAQVASVWSVGRSWSVATFYGALLAAMVALSAFLMVAGGRDETESLLRLSLQT